MSLASARRLQRLIRKLSEADGRFYEQGTRGWWQSDQEPPLAQLRRESWRHWWHLSETALIAECGTAPSPWCHIQWDTPARDVVLWYTKVAS